jgi:hypothetical protein
MNFTTVFRFLREERKADVPLSLRDLGLAAGVSVAISSNYPLVKQTRYGERR